MVVGLKKLMACGEGKGPINLGNPEELTILSLAEIIRELTGSRSEIHFEALPADDPVRRKPDISAAEKLLNWKPRGSLEEGLKQTVDYFDQLLRDEGGSE